MNKIEDSLSRKILSVVAIVFIGITIASYITITSLLKETLYKLERDKAHLIIENHAPLMAMSLFLEMQDQLNILVDNIMKNEEVLKVTVRNKSDIIVSRTKKDSTKGIEVQIPIYKPNASSEIGNLKIIYSTNHFNQLIDKYFILLMISMLVIVLIFIGLNVYIKKLLKPLKKLARILKHYSPEDDIEIPYLNEVNEIGLISNAMDISHKKTLEYSKNLQKLTKKLQSNNDNLEKRVKHEIEIIKQKDRQLIYQSRLAQMGEMISMIAHQWRQPLTAISATGNNLILKLMMDDVDHKLFQEEINLITEYSEHLSTTIDDFREFFKKNKIKAMVTLDKIVNSTLDIIKTSIENKDIEIIKKLNSNEEFETYPNEVKQVVLNLLKNAEDVLLEKEKKNPQITIETKCTDTNIILIVKDNAGGVPENIIDKIFDPYFSTKLEKDGTGLGLYMSKTIIEEHCDGKLSVTNDHNGAVFTITLDRVIHD